MDNKEFQQELNELREILNKRFAKGDSSLLEIAGRVPKVLISNPGIERSAIMPDSNKGGIPELEFGARRPSDLSFEDYRNVSLDDFHHMDRAIYKEIKVPNMIYTYEGKTPISKAILHYIEGIGIRVEADKISGYDKNGNPMCIASFYLGNEKLRTSCDDTYGPVEFTIYIAEDHLNHDYRKLDIANEQVRFERRGETEWALRIVDKMNRFYLGVSQFGKVKHIDITSDRFNNIIIHLDSNARDFFQDTGRKFVIVVGQQRHAPVAYIEKLIESFDNSDMLDEEKWLFKLLLRDPRVEERLQKLLDKMPLSLNKAYDDLKSVIDTEYQNKLDELNKESQIINAMGMLSQDNLGMFDENKHMTYGIDDSSRIKK